VNYIIFTSKTSVAVTTTPPYGYAVDPTRHKFAPRIGLAWDPFKKSTTSVRLGYGLYYDQLSFSFFETGLVSTNPPFQQVVTVNPTTLDNPTAGTTTVSNAVQDVAGIDPHLKTPYVQ